ncbi:serine hydrolase domain-containing protein [Lysinibacillus fusiformis]|uniref:serine hydrolase domain-containing protein n=1 Tax=Lysinibacillus fusiformis TaxID=28031 RepID=UPI0004A7B068|nr:serine hydrolase domain-containing protein [Lysinibacillus fusiformis]
MLTIYDRMVQKQIAGLSLAFIEHGEIQRTECIGVLEVGSTDYVNEETIFNACSISKLLTSILVLKLVEQGKIDLDEDINRNLFSWKLPESDYTRAKKVTVRSLLSHQSGIVDPEDSFSPLHSLAQWPSMKDLLQGATSYCQSPIKSSLKPNQEFHYSDAGYCIIQLLIEDVINTPFPSLMNDLIFQPLAMNHSFFSSSLPIAHTASGHHKDGTTTIPSHPLYPYDAACGIWTTPSDLAKLLIDMMQTFKGKGKLGLTATTMHELMHTQGCHESVGLGVFLDDQGEQVEISSLGWGVGYQCMLVAYPYLEKGFVVMSNTDSGVHQMQGIMGDIYRTFVLSV